MRPSWLWEADADAGLLKLATRGGTTQCVVQVYNGVVDVHAWFGTSAGMVRNAVAGGTGSGGVVATRLSARQLAGRVVRG
jgi:hypothetical protein